MLVTVAISGADDSVDIEQLSALCVKYPFAEIGVLYGAHGPAPRFPSTWWLNELAWTDCPFALHLCARQLIERGLRGDWPAVTSGIEIAWGRARRIQLNFHGKGFRALQEPAAIERGLRHPMLRQRPVILQLDGRNDAPCIWAAHEFPDVVHLLFDRSHGGGIAPGAWPPPPVPGVATGYAGGLTPGTVADALRECRDAPRADAPAAVPAIHPDAAWVDAETGLMTDGEFDPRKAEAFLAACAPYVGQPLPR